MPQNSQRKGEEKEIADLVTCQVCLNIFDKVVLVVPCLHRVCKQCFFKKLVSTERCPICKTRLSFRNVVKDVRVDHDYDQLVRNTVALLKTGVEELQPRVDTVERQRAASFSKFLGKWSDNSPEDVELIGVCIKSFKRFSHHLVSHNTHGVGNEGHVNQVPAPTPSCGKLFMAVPGPLIVGNLAKILKSHLGVLEPKGSVTIYCDGHELDHFTCMKRVWLEYWQTKKHPMVLHYSVQAPDLTSADIT